MNNDLISRKALREDLRRFFPAEVLEGIEPKTLFAQIMHDIDNAPTISPQALINGIVEIINENGLTSVDELLEILKKGG